MKNTLFPLILIFLLMMFSIYGGSDLIGPVTQDDILESFPEWREVMSSYAPQEEAIEKLKTIDFTVEIEVILGTWCPDSREHVSAYFKIIELAENPLIVSSYIGIPKEKEEREPYIRGKNIQKIPTFIVFLNGEEIGRIIEHPEKSVEEDLVDIIESKIY
jgi:thiol-disulfide isomerase/thioredoxin